MPATSALTSTTSLTVASATARDPALRENHLHPSPCGVPARRLARKEAKTAIAPIRRPAGANRSAVADLKRRVYAIEKRNGPLKVRQSTRAAILSIRTLGAREAKASLQSLPTR